MRHVDRFPASIAALTITAAFLLGACSATAVSTPSQTSVPATPSPTQPAIPSPACGGFHLDVVNRSATAVDVELNGIPSSTVQAGEDSTIYQYGPGGVSGMPWTVTIVDPATKTVIATRDVTEASGQGAATIEVDAGTGATAVVGAVKAAKGC